MLEKFQDAGFSGVLVCPAGYVAVHQQILERKLELADHDKKKCPYCPKGATPLKEGDSQPMQSSSTATLEQQQQQQQQPTPPTVPASSPVAAQKPAASGWGFQLPTINASALMGKISSTSIGVAGMIKSTIDELQLPDLGGDDNDENDLNDGEDEDPAPAKTKPRRRPEVYDSLEVVDTSAWHLDPETHIFQAAQIGVDGRGVSRKLVVAPARFLCLEDHESRPQFAYVHASFPIDQLRRMTVKKRDANVVTLSFLRIVTLPETQAKGKGKEAEDLDPALLWTKTFAVDTADTLITLLKRRLHAQAKSKAKSTEQS